MYLLHIQEETVNDELFVKEKMCLKATIDFRFKEGMFVHNSHIKLCSIYLGMRFISPFYTLPRGGGGYHHATRWGDSLPQRGPHHAATWGGYRRECGVRHHSSTEHNLVNKTYWSTYK